MAVTTQEHSNTRARPSAAVTTHRWVSWLIRHWVLVASLVLGLYSGLPWMAPVFMRVGWAGAGRAIYAVYSTQCHQLPQRSYFLFGPRVSYSLDQVQAAWQATSNPLVLRQFTGNVEMGWKVAWSDRMVAMWGSILIFGLLYAPLRRRLRPLPLWAFALLILPMGLDGATHTLSDLAGLGRGFRDTNAWLAALTGSAFPASFYAGDALGSFNAWMRLLTAVPFGLGFVWLLFPYVENLMAYKARRIETGGTLPHPAQVP